MYTTELETRYFDIKSFRQRDPRRNSKGHIRWVIEVNRFALIQDDYDLELVYSMLHPGRGPTGYGHDRVFKTREAAEHTITLILMKLTQ